MIDTDRAAPGFLGPGQQVAQDGVRRAAARDRLQRTLLVHGAAGAGTGAFVDDLLALLFCLRPDGADAPCNRCRGCRDARARTHPDLVIGSLEVWRGDRSTGESIVASARRWLLGSAGAPVAGEVRVVLIDGADEANEQTQNALLKALEEPAPRQMFILVASEPSRLLPTIRSRAQSVRIGPVPRAELAGWLMDHHDLPADEADDLARISGGLAGTAIDYATNPARLAWRRETQTELLALLERGSADRFGAIRDLLGVAARQGEALPATDAGDAADGAPATSAEQRRGALLVMDAWTDLARDLLLTAAGHPEQAPSAHLVHGVASAAARIDAGRLRAFLARAEEIRGGLRENAAPRLAMEIAMLAWPNVDETS